MSASLLVAVPFALFGIVLLLCFVGCDRVFGIYAIDPPPPPFTRYSEVILGEPTLVAYWPLGEQAGETTAVDLKGGRNGTYLSQALPDDPSFPSAAAPGTLTLGQEGIVPGDRVPPFDDTSPRTTCIEVNGGYVSVPFDPALNPTTADGFTLEAWVRVEWSAGDTAATRIIMNSFDTTGGDHGYGLFAGPANNWEGAVGTPGGPVFLSGPEILFDTTNHIVLTYDGHLLRLFVNGTQTAAIAGNYQPSAQSSLFIGVGGPFLPQPRGPWVGKIQCVALYTGALPPDEVSKHAVFGNGGNAS